MTESLDFREWILNDGGRWEAFKHALKTGAEAYSKKRKEQKKKTEKSDLLKKLMNPKSKSEEDSAIDSIVRNGYTLSSNGKLEDRKSSKINAAKDMQKWMNEHDRTNETSSEEKSSRERGRRRSFYCWVENRDSRECAT